MIVVVVVVVCFCENQHGGAAAAARSGPSDQAHLPLGGRARPMQCGTETHGRDSGDLAQARCELPGS
jgi:hypothetical protein